MAKGRALNKLKKEIVLGGGRKLALFVCLAALAGAYADGLTPMYGKASGSNGGVHKTITWYSNEACTSTADVITPWQEGSNTCSYTIFGVKKITGISSFPDVPVSFKASGWVSCDCGITLTAPNLTIYSGTFAINSASASPSTLYGDCTFVSSGTAISFMSTGVKDATDKRGWNLAGTYAADSDVSVGFYLNKFDTTLNGGVAYQIWSGDFSAFKGRFAMAAKVPAHSTGTGYFGVRLTSPTALGDTSYPRTDALVLKKDAHLSMSGDVVQDGTRGITNDLANGECVCLDNEVADAWTLKAPMYGSVGTLKKVGFGTVTLAGSMQITNIVVESGTLAVSNGAAFASDTKIVVTFGASFVNQTGGDIPNVTVSYAPPQSTLIVPFDGSATTPFDFTAYSASDIVGWATPVAIALSQSIPLPFSETNRLALAAFSASAGVTADMFEDITGRNYGLPTSWIETETANGITTLYLVARPAVQLTGDTDAKMMKASNWSDGQLPRPGRDYYSGYGSYANRTGSGSTISSYSFEGESFTLTRGEQYLGDYAQDFFATEVRLFKGNGIYVSHGNSGGRTRVLRGRCLVTSEATDEYPAYVTFDPRTTYADFQMELAGNGTFRFTTQVTNVVGKGIYPFYLTGQSTNYAGRVEVTTAKAEAFMDMYVTNGAAFGGPLPAYSVDAVRINPPSAEVDHAVSITATADMTVDTTNRGWYMTSGTLGASNGVTFVFAPPTLTLTTKLCKTGGGMLALGCDTIGEGTAFAVEEGYVKALSAGCCTNLNLTVSAGAGIKADLAPSDATVAAKGLIAKSLQPAEEGGTILVAPDISPDFDEPQVAVVACTVPAAQADLTGTLLPTYIKGYKGRVEKDDTTYAAEGLVTYTARWLKTGLTVTIR